jgi:hypothetical protein
MMGWLRSLIFPRPKSFICGWALRRSAFHEVANNDMPRDLGELIELHGTRLEYREMLALAEMFIRWADTEDVTEEQRARLLRSGREFAQLAAFCGPDWEPRNRDEQQPDLLRFIAHDALIDDDDCRRSDRAEVAEEFLEALAKRMTALLDASPDPDALMASIREKAGQAGIMPPGMKIRSLPYAAFVRDLLLDNPRAIDWAYRSRFDMASANVSDETELLGLIALRGRA